MFMAIDIGSVVKDAIFNGIDLITESGVDSSRFANGIFTLVAQILATVVLFLVVRFFFWNIVTGIIEKRKKAALEGLEEAQNLQDEANKNKEESQKILDDAKVRSAEIIANAQLSAKNEAQHIMDEAQKSIQSEKQKALDEVSEAEKNARINLKKEITDVAFELAGKMINKNLDPAANNEVINEYLQGKDNE